MSHEHERAAAGLTGPGGPFESVTETMNGCALPGEGAVPFATGDIGSEMGCGRENG